MLTNKKNYAIITNVEQKGKTMKTQETTFTVKNIETKTGNTNGRDWEIKEYIIEESVELDNGEMMTTTIPARASASIGELVVGGTYKGVMFITSRESERDGKKSYWPSFRITRAELVGASDPEPEEPKQVDELDSDLPF